MDIETLAWLQTDDGRALLDAAAHAWADHDGDPVRVATAVRRLEPDADKAAAATTQVQRGARGRQVRRCRTPPVFFTPDALEQATRQRVAAHRAARLAAAIPGGSVVDLGCGIGGDLIAFARAGLIAAGIDQDPVRVAMARANLAALDLAGAVQVGDATTVDPSGFGAAFADPARRGGRGRIFDVDGWTPPWPWVLDLLSGRAVVKLAPGLPHDLVPDGVEAEWVSDGGDVKEAVLWSRGLATTDRRATVIGDGGLASLTSEDDPYAVAERPVREVGAFLYEPDGAVIRAGLVTAVAAGSTADWSIRTSPTSPATTPSGPPSPVPTGSWSTSPTVRSSSRPPCASAASVGSRSRSVACRSCRRSCASGSPCAATRRPPWCSPAWPGRAPHCWSSPSDSPR